MKNTTRVMIALAAGAAIGGILGILFAPDKGSATRGKIADKASDFADGVKDYVSKGKEKLSSMGKNWGSRMEAANETMNEYAE